MTAYTEADMQFAALPIEVQLRLLACHLKTHMQLVDDLEDDIKILLNHQQHRLLELHRAEDALKSKNAKIDKYRQFLQVYGLSNAFKSFAAKSGDLEEGGQS